MIAFKSLRYIREIDGPRRIKHMAALVALSLITAILEMAGIGMVFPVVAAINDPAILDKIPGYPAFKALVGAVSHDEAVVYAASMLVGIFLVKNAYAAIYIYVQAAVISKWQKLQAERLFGVYINAPYMFHRQSNSATLIRNISHLSLGVYVQTISNLVILGTDLLLAIGLIGLLLWVQPLPSLVAATLMIGFVVIQNFSFRGIHQRLGVERNEISRLHIRALQQYFAAVKEIKVWGRERNVINNFGSIQERRSQYRRKFDFFSRLPSLVSETSMVVAVLGTFILLIYLETGKTEMIASLALMSAVAFRLMPLSNRVVSALNSLHNASPGMELLKTELDVQWSAVGSQGAGNHFELTNEILFDDISYSYPDGEHAALSNITLEIKKGESIGLLGGSGAGKTTLVDIMLGLMAQENGNVLVDGVDIHDDIRSWRASIGYVPQQIIIIDDTVRANVALFVPAEEVNEQQIWSSLERAHLAEFVKDLPDGLDTVLGETGSRLSGGQKQRIAIARALYYDPAVLVLDEATSALDVKTESEISRMIKEFKGKKTILIIAHRLSTLKHCDKLVLLKSGRVDAVGTFEELNRDNIDFKELLKLAEITIHDSSAVDKIS